MIFGKDVVAKIRLKWTSSSFSLYVNDVLVQTNSVSRPTAPNWSSLWLLTIGSRSTRRAAAVTLPPTTRSAELCDPLRGSR